MKIGLGRLVLERVVSRRLRDLQNVLVIFCDASLRSLLSVTAIQHSNAASGCGKAGKLFATSMHRIRGDGVRFDA